MRKQLNLKRALQPRSDLSLSRCGHHHHLPTRSITLRSASASRSAASLASPLCSPLRRPSWDELPASVGIGPSTAGLPKYCDCCRISRSNLRGLIFRRADAVEPSLHQVLNQLGQIAFVAACTEFIVTGCVGFSSQVDGGRTKIRVLALSQFRRAFFSVLPGRCCGGGFSRSWHIYKLPFGPTRKTFQALSGSVDA